MPLMEAMPQDTTFATTAPRMTPATAYQLTVSVTSTSRYFSRSMKKLMTRMMPTGGSVQFRIFSQPQKFQYSQTASAVPTMPEMRTIGFFF